MKASPERPGDLIEFFAEIDLLAGVSTRPGGDCGAAHPSDVANAIRFASISFDFVRVWLPTGSLGRRTDMAVGIVSPETG